MIEQNEANNSYTGPTPLRTVSPVASSDLVACRHLVTVRRARAPPSSFAVTLRNQGTIASASGAHGVTLTVRGVRRGGPPHVTGSRQRHDRRRCHRRTGSLGAWTAASGTRCGLCSPTTPTSCR
ncbi:hypothetical protein V2I01_39375 [Micromonospora sp. BRA006-A]|nr:hypothetical protein [Micromonospora sp. BRA006-A]